MAVYASSVISLVYPMAVCARSIYFTASICNRYVHKIYISLLAYPNFHHVFLMHSFLICPLNFIKM